MKNKFHANSRLDLLKQQKKDELKQTKILDPVDRLFEVIKIEFRYYIKMNSESKNMHVKA